MDSREQLFTIHQVSTKLNIPKPTLRFWEKELDGIIVPIRTLGKQRRYNLEHLTIIAKVKELREKGMNLSEIKWKLGKGQMSEAGSQRSGDERTDGIDLLADRVTEVVRAEVHRFFEGET